MSLGKVQNQKLELLRVTFRNMYLKEKCEYLDGECKMLAEHLLSSQITKEEKSEINVSLAKTLRDLRDSNEEKMLQLALAEERLLSMKKVFEDTKSSLVASSDTNKSIDEDVDMKDQRIECLQAELVHFRLIAAEQWATIRELQEAKNELEREKDLLFKAKPETIARLQEELIQGKLLGIQYSREFDKIREHLGVIKSELITHKTPVNGNKDDKQIEGNVNVSRKGVIWKSNGKKYATETNKVIQEITKLEQEKLYLQSRIPDLENKVEILSKHLQFKEAERCRLQDKLDDISLKHKNIEFIVSERCRQYDQLKNSGSETVCLIRNNTIEKRENINELSTKLQTVSQLPEIYSNRIKLKDLETLHDLEDEVSTLEEQVSRLMCEITMLRAEKRRKASKGENTYL